MKRQLSYQELRTFAVSTAARLPQESTLVAVSRGGLTFGHLVAYLMAKPLGFFLPKDGRLLLPDDQPGNNHLVFLEDLVAKGRTLNAISCVATEQGFASWELACVVEDAGFTPTADQASRVRSCIKTSDWIVFPHENFDSVVEGDWGLFRDRTSHNSVPQL